MSEARIVLEARDLTKVYAKGAAKVIAVDGVSFSVRAGECLGIVGESGSGKSTIANIVVRLLDATSGTVVLNGQEITCLRGKELRGVRRRMQMVFQQPAGSFDPRRSLGDGIAESLRNDGMGRREARRRTEELLELVELPASFYDRYPQQASGGQCQRAAIARALATSPDLLVCDEATSALDVTVQSQVVELLSRLRAELGVAMLFICHDIALVAGACEEVLVMKGGRAVEQGPTSRVLHDPQDPYTRLLIESVL